MKTRYYHIIMFCFNCSVVWAQSAQWDYSRTPVLMIHGWFVSQYAGDATFAYLKKCLSDNGWPDEYLFSPTFKDVQGCDPEHAQEIAQWVEDLKKKTGFGKIDIVAHSEGALNAIYYIRELCGVHNVRKMVSLAGAFHGTVTACIGQVLGSCGAEEMCIEAEPKGQSKWYENLTLANLMSCDETPGDILYTCLWSEYDEIIVPPEGSMLKGCENIEFETKWAEHGGIFLLPESCERVKTALLTGGKNEDGPGWECIPKCAKEHQNLGEMIQDSDPLHEAFDIEINDQEGLATEQAEDTIKEITTQDAHLGTKDSNNQVDDIKKGSSACQSMTVIMTQPNIFMIVVATLLFKIIRRKR